MDRVTEGLLGTWAKNHGAIDLDESTKFEYFVNFIVLSRHYGEQFTVDDYSCGQGGTLGIDGFAVAINGELVATLGELEDAISGQAQFESSLMFVQAKRSTSFSLGELSVFADTVVALTTNENPPSRQLKSQHDMIRRLFQESHRFVENPVCRMYFVTAGNWQNPAPLEAKMEDTRRRLADSNLLSRVDFHCWGAKQIQDNWRAIDSPLAVTIQFESRTTLPEMQGIREAYLGVLPGTEFVKLVTDEEGEIRKTLFFDNVRDFLQAENDVNQDIEKTLRSGDASLFCVLNNGVTAVARDLKITGNKFTLKDFQIVNGCQTSHILHRNRSNLEDVFVPFRLISAADEQVANSITRATNNQSPVTPENLMALSDLQRRIESYFNSFEDDDSHRIYYERRSKQWSGSPQVRGTWRVITVRNLMQAFASLYVRIPHTAARYYGDLRGRVGGDVFSEQHHAAYYYSAAYAFCKLDHFFRSSIIPRDMKPAKYHLLAGVRTLATNSVTTDYIESGEKKAEVDCKKFNAILWNDQTYQDCLLIAAEALREVAGERELSRDFGRTRDFTDQYLRALLER